MTLVEAGPGTEQDHTTTSADAVKGMAVVLPEAQRPQTSGTIDLRTSSPSSSEGLRADLGANYLSLKDRLPEIGAEASSVVTQAYEGSVFEDDAISLPEPVAVERTEKTKEARGRLKGFFSRNKDEEPEQVDASDQIRSEAIERLIHNGEAADQSEAEQMYEDDPERFKKEAARAARKQKFEESTSGQQNKILNQARKEAYKENQKIDEWLSAVEQGKNEPANPGEAAFVKDVKKQLDGARNLAELHEKAKLLIAHNGLAEDPDSGWYKPAGDSRESKLTMYQLDKASEALGDRRMVQRLRDRGSIQEERKQEYLDNRAQKQAESKQRAQDEIKRQIDEFEAKLEDLPSFKDYVAEKQAEARKPIDERIAYLRNVELPKLKDRKNKRRAMSSDWIKDGTKMDKQIQAVKDEITKLEKQAQKAEKEAKKDAKAERRSISEQAVEKSDKALDLIDGSKPGRVNFSPQKGQDPDKSLVIADRIGKEVGKKVEANGLPFQVNEYKLNGVTMQRLVYRTGRPDVVVVEEWNKEAGALKSQTVMKGANVLVTNSENDGFGGIRSRVRRNRGNERMVLNDSLYASDKLVKSSGDWSDGGGGSYDTDAAVSYASRLDRSGISSRGKYEMASGRYKTKNSKGTKSFIKMLQEGLVNGGNK